jgi:lysophospholipase L1-like esterase
MARLSVPLLFTIAVAWGNADVTGVPHGAGGKILQADFSDAATYKPIPKREFVSGSLPEGWHDEAAWSKAGCSYAFQKEGNTGFLRAICPGDKRLQFFHLIDGFATRKAFKLSFRARSKGKVELKFRLQESGKPSSFAAVDIGLQGEWADYSAIFASRPADGKSLGLRIFASGPCTVDLASLMLTELPWSDYVPPTCVPTPRPNHPGWLERFQRATKRMREQKPAFVILGDSITGAWEAQGKDAWATHIASLKACAFGIAGDGVEHLLWRVEHSGLGTDFQPALVAILIGVNNLFTADTDEIAAGTSKLIALIRQRSPTTKVLLLGVFPVGEKPTDPRRQLIREVNARYEKLADAKQVFYMDIGPGFLERDGTLKKETFFDFVHCTPQSYDVYATKLAAKARELMEKSK